MKLSIYEITYEQTGNKSAKYIVSNRTLDEVQARFEKHASEWRDKPTSVGKPRLAGKIDMPSENIPLIECCFSKLNFVSYVRRGK